MIAGPAADKALTPAGAIRRLDGPGILFAPAEIACRETGQVRLHPGFADALAELRMVFGAPMVVTSCCRSAAHNARVGGHPRSLHVYDRPNHGAQGTLAIDIRIRDAAYAWRLVYAAQRLGWSIGLARSFVHLDRRDLVGLPRAAFGYGGGR